MSATNSLGADKGGQIRRTILVYDSQNVRCDACGTHMRVIGDGQDHGHGSHLAALFEQ